MLKIKPNKNTLASKANKILFIGSLLPQMSNFSNIDEGKPNQNW